MYTMLKNFISIEYIMLISIIFSFISTIYLILFYKNKASSYQKIGIAAFIFLFTSLFVVTILYFFNIDLMKTLFLLTILIFPIWVTIAIYITYKKGADEQKERVVKGLNIIGLTVVLAIIFFIIMYIITR